MLKKTRWWLAAAILLAWLPTIVPAAYSAVWQWSQTASSNASADPSINWREGQPPSSINDSARAMMAALAAYRDDISGLLTTTGTSTAYQVTTNQGLCATSPCPAPQDGQQLSITVNITNGAGVTLQADGGTSYPIQNSAGNAVPSGTLIQGSPYTLRFSAANSAWMLRDFYSSPFIVPLGGLVPYTGSTVPNSNFVFPAGQCLSTTTYAAYWQLVGSPASGSCPGGQFQIIDMRGMVPAALDNLNGVAAGRLTSSTTGCGTAMTTIGATCANGREQYALTAAMIPTITSGGSANVSAAGDSIAITASAGIGSYFTGSQPGGVNVLPASVSGWTQATSLAGTSSVTSNNTGSGNHPEVQPTIAVTYLLRVL